VLDPGLDPAAGSAELQVSDCKIIVTAESQVITNQAAVSLLLSRLLVDAPATALAAHSSDSQFSWMDGQTGELDGETLAELMAGALADLDALPWDTLEGGLQRSSFDDFETEDLHLYLIDRDFVLAAVCPKNVSVAELDSRVSAILGDLRQFLA
jgi:hypothetical protein